MKNLALALLILITGGNLHAQKAGKLFKLNGKLVGTSKDTVILSYLNPDGKYLHSREIVKDGKFTVTGYY